MAYQTGTVNNATDLKDIIETFAQANGWTLSSGILSKGQCHVRLTAINTDQGIKLEGANSADFLTGVCPNWVQIYIDSAQWPITYHLFAHGSPDTFVCVLNYNVNQFQYLAFGDVTKFGTWTGGNWFSATMSSQSTVLPSMLAGNPELVVDTVIGNQTTEFSYTGRASGGLFVMNDGSVGGAGSSLIHTEIDAAMWLSTYRGDLPRCETSSVIGPLISRIPNAWNSQAVLLPCHLLITRASNKRSVIGEIGHVRHLRVDNYNPGDIITIGSDRWKVFPWIKKDSSNRNGYRWGAYHSGTFGWAIRYDGP